MLSMSDRVRRARVNAGLSQTQLAMETGVKRSAVAQWEREGGTFPSVQHMARIAVVTKVRFEWLATGRGSGQADDEAELALNAAATDTRSELENEVLALLRRLPPRKRQVAHAIIEMLTT